MGKISSFTKSSTNKLNKIGLCISSCFTPQEGENGLPWLGWWFSFAPDFQCWYFCESSCLFYLRFNFDFYVSKIMHL